MNKWVLCNYNDIAKEINIIGERTYSQVDLAREFRDLIHPGREVRKRAKCTKSTAHAGIAAVGLVIEDLTEWVKNLPS